MATIVAARAERAHNADHAVLLGSNESIQYANDYYGRLLRTFPGDTLTRAWAAVRGAMELPFLAANMAPPAWAPSGLDGGFRARAGALSWAAVVPPLVAAVAVLVILGGVSARLGVLAVLMTALLAGMTSVQFQDRHMFQLEILPLWVYGVAAAALWGARRRGAALRVPAVWRRAAVAAALLAAVVVVPVAAARRYQQGAAASLFSSYEYAEAEPVTIVAGPSADPSRVMLATTWQSAAHARRFVDSDVLVLDFGGERCDADAVSVTYRYHAVPPYSDLTRQAVVPVPASGDAPTRVFFPVYSLGERMGVDALSFTGVELLPAQAPCLLGVRRFTRPESFPLLMEAVLVPGWRQVPLRESLQNLEAPDTARPAGIYGIPEGLAPLRSELPNLQPVAAPPAYRSQLVSGAVGRLQFSGTPETPAAYLVNWAPEWHAAGSRLFVEGEVAEGGLTVGLQRDDRWVHQLNIDRSGPFRATVRVDADGPYAVILANHLTRSRHQRSSITQYGWLPPNP